MHQSGRDLRCKNAQRCSRRRNFHSIFRCSHTVDRTFRDIAGVVPRSVTDPTGRTRTKKGVARTRRGAARETNARRASDSGDSNHADHR
jgi:hypothetical protein